MSGPEDLPTMTVKGRTPASRGDDSDALQEALDTNIKERSKRAKKQMTDDDLTVVIVKLNQKEND